MKLHNLVFLYFRKFFNLKNIVLFLVSALCYFTVYTAIAYPIQFLNEESYKYNIDRIKIIIANIWLATIIQYGIIYLKKNNLNKINKMDNFYANLIVIFTVLFTFYLFLWFFIINDSLYKENYKNWGTLIKDMFFIFLFLNLSEILFFTLFNINSKNYKVFYVMIIAFILLNLNFMFFLFESGDGVDAIFDLNPKKFLYSFIMIFASMIIINLSKILIKKQITLN